MTFSDEEVVNTATEITQAHIDALLLHLKTLREQIAQARALVAPLNEKLTLVYNDYQAAVGRLRNEAHRLKAELYALEDQIARAGIEEEVFPTASNVHGLSEPPPIDEHRNISSTVIDPEEFDKELLLIHLTRVLDDHMLNKEDGELLSQVNGMFQNPATRLGDVLEHVPWGVFWTQRNVEEDLKAQHQRLATWEHSLEAQLQSLTKKQLDLQRDRRYAMYEQYQKGVLAWQQFLSQVVQQQQAYNEELAAAVQQKREEWAEIVRKL